MRTILVGIIILIFISVQLMRGGAARYTIEGDGSGYYAYLTTVFVYKTTDFKDVYSFEKSWRGLDYMAHYFHTYGDKLINKYFLGTSLLILPFFLMAMLFCLISGIPPDGYNFIFQYSVAMAAAFYTSAGLLFLNRSLRTFGIDKVLVFILLLVMLLGTNLFYYTFLHPSMSHAYSFFAVSAFLYCVRSFFIQPSGKWVHLAALSLGLVMLIRPTNMLVIMAVPFIAGSLGVFKKGVDFIFRKNLQLISSAIVFFMVFGLQWLFNFIQTGKVFIWSYNHEGFNFLKPEFFDFLVSYRKGFFVYTPLFLLLLPSLAWLFIYDRYKVFSFGLFFVLLTYVLSSWWNWFFGDSFGMRALIDYYPLFLVPVALFLKSLSTNRKYSLVAASYILIVLTINLIQSYQYNARIIHPDSMTRDKYWYVFLKTGDEYKNVFGGFSEPVYQFPYESDKLGYFNDFESTYSDWSQDGIQSVSDAWSGNRVARMGGTTIYSPTLVLDNNKLSLRGHPVYVDVRVMYREIRPEAAGDALLVYAATDRRNLLLFYKTFKLKQLPGDMTKTWHNAEFGFKVPEWNDEVQQVKIYIWQRGEAGFELDDFEIRFTLLNNQ